MPRLSRTKRSSSALQNRRMVVEQLEDRSLLAGDISINAIVPNNPPSGTDSAVFVLEDATHTVVLSDFGFSDPLDSPPNGFAGVRIATLPASGVLRLNGTAVTAGQSISAAAIAAGTLRYTPPANASGSPLARITFQVQDDGSTADGGVPMDPTPNTLSINVTPVNDPPSGGDVTLTVFEDTMYGFGAGDFRFSDPLDSPPHAFANIVVVSAPTGLVLGGVQVADGQVVPVSAINARDLRYVPPPNLSGLSAARIVFQVQDSGGTANGGSNLDPTPNILTINIPAINDAPSGADTAITTWEDIPYVFQTADFPYSDPSDVPPNQFAAVWIASLPHSGRLVLGSSPVVGGQIIPQGAIAAGQLRYLPDENVNGLALASFSFQVADDGGFANGGEFLDPTPNVLTIHVTPVNDSPVANDDSGLVNESGVLDVAAPGLLLNDTDVDVGDTRAVSTVAGSAAAVGLPVVLPSGAIVVVRADGSFRYDPNGRFEHLSRTGLATDGFEYEIRDAGGLTATARMNITIQGANDSPTAGNDDYTTPEDEPLIVAAPGVLFNDADVDGDNLAAAVVDQPLHGTLSLRPDGGFAYFPPANYHGLDQFTYRASDGLAVSNVTTVALTVASQNDPPLVIVPASASVAEGSPLVIDGSFVDPDAGDSWTATVDFGNGPQPLALEQDQSFRLTQTFADNGTYPVRVDVRDSSGLVGSADLLVTVTNVAPQNVSLEGPAAGTSGEAVTFVGRFTDPGIADTFAAVLVWGDGTTTNVPVGQLTSGSPFSVSHTYSAAGNYIVRLQVADDDGGATAAAPRSITIGPGETAGPSLRNGVLEITGSPRADNIALSLSGGKIVVNGTYGGVNRNLSFNQGAVQQIVANLDGGDDVFKVASNIRTSLIVNGGAGNDRITAGGGPSIISGGNGADLLYGGAGRDVLIGGAGQDQLWGYGGSDLLIAGSTAYDANPQALAAILAEWSSLRGFKARANNLRSGAGPVLAGSSVKLQTGVTVFDDAEVDSLMGNGDNDWFFANSRRDKLNDRAELMD